MLEDHYREMRAIERKLEAFRKGTKKTGNGREFYERLAELELAAMEPTEPAEAPHRPGAPALRRVRGGQAQALQRQPAPGRLDRQEVPQPRPVLPRPDPGRQHRPDEGGREVRVPPRLQVLDLRHVVDPPGDHPLDRRPGADDPHPGAHDRDDEQAAQRHQEAGADRRAASPRSRRSPRRPASRSRRPSG